MGDIIGGIIGGIGSIIGGNTAAKAQKQAATTALTGFNYLTGPKGVQSYVDTGTGANSDINALLMGGPNSDAANKAFGNYLNSTGYNFQLQQGQKAITGSAAARGLLNSGGTAKALETFGQGLAGNYFQQYLNQLGTLAARGLGAGEAIGQAGSVGGSNAAQLQAAAGATNANTINSVAGTLQGLVGNVFGGASGIPGSINVTPNQITGGY